MTKIDFEQLSLKYQEKEIIKCCKKLAKSCVLTKSKDVSTLCELAYWFYIYDYQDEVLNIYNLVNIEIPQRVNYNIWTWILSIYGLQAYIYELNGETTEKDKIIEKINKIYSVPRRDPTIEDKNHPFTHFILELWGVKGFRVLQGILGIILIGYGLLYLFIG